MMIDKDLKHNRIEDELPSKDEIICALSYVACLVLILAYFWIG
jgi:hypothetical protein